LTLAPEERTRAPLSKAPTCKHARRWPAGAGGIQAIGRLGGSDGIDVDSDTACSLFANSSSKHAPVATFHMVLRAQPLHDTVVAPFTCLSAGHGLLFAAPTRSGNLAVYARAGTKITVRTRMAGGERVFWRVSLHADQRACLCSTHAALYSRKQALHLLCSGKGTTPGPQVTTA
jgi:hypothetical protein